MVTIAKPASCTTTPERQKVLEEKRRQLAKNGITDAQRAAGHGLLSQRLYDAVVPRGYEGHALEIANGVLLGRKRDTFVGSSREDAWALYLGLGQPHGTFAVSSDVREGKCADANAEAYRFSNATNTERNLLYGMLRERRLLERIAASPDDPKLAGYAREALKETRDQTVDYFSQGQGEGVIQSDEPPPGVMGTFTRTIGRDEEGPYVSYYDVWDLDPKVLGVEVPAELVAGHPYTIYGRIHYDPDKAARIMDLEDELISRRQVPGTPGSEELRTDPGRWVVKAHVEQLVGSFRTGLPENVRPLAEELAKLDPIYANPVFSKDVAPW